MDEIEVEIAELDGPSLGYAEGSRIYIDADASGAGWSVDSTPITDVEFFVDESGILQAMEEVAEKRFDLLSVMSHEIGRVLGLEEIFDAMQQVD